LENNKSYNLDSYLLSIYNFLSIFFLAEIFCFFLISVIGSKYLLASNITNSNGRILFSRDLDYGFAITSHRAQGSTYRNVFVDINDMIYDKYGHPYTNRDEMLRRLYVACSRASNQLVLSYGK
jgi:hypothetical protein